LIGWLVAFVLLALPAHADPVETLVESGPVSALVRLSPPEPAIGDPLILELEVRAESGVELLMPEFGEALDRYAIVDFSHSERADDQGGTISVQRYTLQPARSGLQSIPALLVEFIDRRPGRDPAPEGEDAYELLTKSIDFAVASVLADDAPLEFRPALGALGPLRTGHRDLWVVLAVAAAALVVAVPLGYRGWMLWRARTRRSSAYDKARSELNALLMAPRPTETEMDAFFVMLSGVIRRYLEDRFALRSPELTTEEFLDELAESPDLLRSHQKVLRDFLRRADLVKFAHYLPTSSDVEDSLDTARRFLEATRGEPGLGAGSTGSADRAAHA
jgi:hypothetical protein